MMWNKKTQPRMNVDIKAASVAVPRRQFSFVVPGLLTLLLAAMGTAGYFYWQYRNIQPGATETKEIQNITQEIGSLMLLPEGETPTLATVTDKEKLLEQPFFQKAENGDKVLIYSNSGRAVLYRPSLKKIIDVTSVNVNVPETPSQAPAVAESTTQTDTSGTPAIIRVALYNGSAVAGAATNLEQKLRAAHSDIAVVTKINAAKEYDASVVTDVTGKNSKLTLQIADEINGIVGTIPKGEKAPTDADVLIVIGKK